MRSVVCLGEPFFYFIILRWIYCIVFLRMCFIGRKTYVSRKFVLIRLKIQVENIVHTKMERFVEWLWRKLVLTCFPLSSCLSLCFPRISTCLTSNPSQIHGIVGEWAKCEMFARHLSWVWTTFLFRKGMKLKINIVFRKAKIISWSFPWILISM